MPRACAHDVVGGAVENASTIVRPHPLRTPLTCSHAVNTNARAQCTELNIPKRDGHTYIHTDAKQDAKQN